MEVVSGAAEEFAEGPFPRPGRAEDQDGSEWLRMMRNDRIGVHKREINQKGEIAQGCLCIPK